MVYLRLLGIVCFFAPFAVLAPPIFGAWVSERRGDVVVAVCGFAAFGMFIGGTAAASGHWAHAATAALRAVVGGLLVGAVFAEIGSVIIAVNVFLIDRVTGSARMFIRGGRPPSDSEAWKTHLPLHSLVTPISMIRSQKSRQR